MPVCFIGENVLVEGFVSFVCLGACVPLLLGDKTVDVWDITGSVIGDRRLVLVRGGDGGNQPEPTIIFQTSTRFHSEIRMLRKKS